MVNVRDPRYANCGATRPTSEADTPTIPNPIFLIDVGNDSPVSVRADARAAAAKSLPVKHRAKTIVGSCDKSKNSCKIARAQRKTAAPVINPANDFFLEHLSMELLGDIKHMS